MVELQHRSAGQPSNHGDAKKFRQKVLGLVREKYGGAVGDGLGRRWPRSIWRPRSSEEFLDRGIRPVLDSPSVASGSNRR